MILELHKKVIYDKIGIENEIWACMHIYMFIFINTFKSFIKLILRSIFLSPENLQNEK